MSDEGTGGRSGFFWVITRPRSYLSILYLLLGLPLGTLYFTVLVTGFSLGIGLMVVALVGIPILIALWYVTHAFLRLERSLTSGLLGVQVPPIDPLPVWPGGLWRQFKQFMGHGPTWKGIGYLLLRFPVGVVTFTVAVTLVSTTLAMTFAPTYTWAGDDVTWGSWSFDPFWWSFLLVPVGVLLTFVSLHVMNALAAACGAWTRWSIGGRELTAAPAPTSAQRAA